MNILVSIHNQKETGPFFKVQEMCEALTRLGNNVTLLCTSKTNRIKINTYIIHNVLIVESPDLLWGRLRQGMDLWNLFCRLLFLTRKKYDIIHLIDCRPVVILPALWMKINDKVPLVISWWDLFGRGGTAEERSGRLYSKTIGIVETFFEEYFRKYADKATVVSQHLKSRLIEFGYPKDKIELIRVGCNLNKFKNINRKMFRQKLGLLESEKVLCHVGALFNTDKYLLIDSLALLKQRVNTLPITLLIGDHKIDKGICKELSISLIGKLKNFSEVLTYLFASDYAILPMRVSIANKSRWPSKTTDYWAAGLPVIATPINDYPDLFSKYNLGYLSKSDRSEDFSDMIYEALNTDRKEWKQKSCAAKIFAETELNWSVIVKRLQLLYESIVKI